MLKIQWDQFLNQNVTIFGNLPYNISAKLLIQWISLNNFNNIFKKFILMFQKEVADRIIAKTNSKNYGRLSIIANWRFEIKKEMNISSSCFCPKPKVDSSLLSFTPKKVYFNIKDPKTLEKISDIFFNAFFIILSFLISLFYFIKLFDLNDNISTNKLHLINVNYFDLGWSLKLDFFVLLMMCLVTLTSSIIILYSIYFYKKNC